MSAWVATLAVILGLVGAILIIRAVNRRRKQDRHENLHRDQRASDRRSQSQVDVFDRDQILREILATGMPHEQIREMGYSQEDIDRVQDLIEGTQEPS